ncbi:MAG TPA: hypothetical protein VGZ22_27575, partial [Isosphaeraceae bacterium]|nr:hypothetical protein [Isosphaeraceae bacterium]
MRTTAIDAVKWSHSFATNAWWKGVWQRLEVKQLADLTGVGAELATTRGVGRTKLFVLIQDLLDMARGPGIRVGEAMRSDAALETIRHSLERIEHGPPSPHAFHVQALFHTLLPMLPTEVRSWDLKSVPWTTEWLYTTSLWKVLGITVVGDLHAVAVSLCHARGIGKGKIVALARELIFLSPELHARLRKAVASHERGEEAGPRDPLGMRHRARPGTLVGAIDRLAERLSDRERDVLHRRIGWRYDRKPEKLRALADDHGVTQERIRQVEQQIRKRMLRLLRIRNVPLKLRETLRGRPAPVELAMIVACGPSELQGMMDVWRPLA